MRIERARGGGLDAVMLQIRRKAMAMTICCYRRRSGMKRSKERRRLSPSAWLGVPTNLTGPSSIAGTTCAANGTCAGRISPLIAPWMKLFVEKDPNFSLDNMTRKEYGQIFSQSRREYNGFVGTHSPDLQEYHKAGGKIIIYHGLVNLTPSFPFVFIVSIYTY